jgi:hypothetical protein
LKKEKQPIITSTADGGSTSSIGDSRQGKEFEVKVCQLQRRIKQLKSEDLNHQRLFAAIKNTLLTK